MYSKPMTPSKKSIQEAFQIRGLLRQIAATEKDMAEAIERFEEHLDNLGELKERLKASLKNKEGGRPLVILGGRAKGA